MSKKEIMTNWRWVMCAMLFFATTVNYMDRQVLSLTFNGPSGSVVDLQRVYSA